MIKILLTQLKYKGAKKSVTKIINILVQKIQNKQNIKI